MSKSANVIVFDISQNMGISEEDKKKFEKAKEALKMQVRNSIFGAPKTEEYALVTLGNTKTNNVMNESSEDEYLNINVEQEMMKVNLGLIKKINNLRIMTKEDEKELEEDDENIKEADVLSGIVVAVQMMNEYCKKRKYKKKITLITNGISPANMDGIDRIAKQITKLSIEILLVGIKFGETFNAIETESAEPNSEGGSSKTIQSLNTFAGDQTFSTTTQKNLRKLTNVINKAYKEQSEDDRDLAIIIEVDDFFEGTAQTGIKKKIAQRGTNYDFGILDGFFNIPIKRIKACEKITFPKTTRVSKLSLIRQAESANAEDNQRYTGKIEIDRTHYLLDEPDVVVGKEEQVKAYDFGKNLIPISAVDEEQLKFQSQKGFDLLGFCDKNAIPRERFMGEGYYIIPNEKGKGYPTNSKYLSVLIQTLDRENKCAIIRQVFRRTTTPRIAVLIPQVKENHDCFIYQELPFLEDVREYNFREPKTDTITEEQTKSMEDLINAFDLSSKKDENGDKVDFFKPKFSFSPITQYFYECVDHLSKDSNDATISGEEFVASELPEVSDSLMKYCAPDLSSESRYTKLVLNPAKNVQEKFDSLFKTEEQKLQEVKVGDKRDYWLMSQGSSIDTATIESANSLERPNKRRKLGNGELSIFEGTNTYVISSSDPVRDIQKFITDNKENENISQIISTIIEKAKDVLIKIINISIKDQQYEKVYKSLVELRKLCLEHDCSSLHFNKLMKDIKSVFSNTSNHHFAFWTYLKEKNITLIHKNLPGSSGSCVPEEEANSFYQEEKKEDEEDKIEDDEGSDDDLFDDLEG